MKKKTQKLNDGYATVHVPKEKKTDFNARETAKEMNDLEFFVEMAFEEQYKREQDYEFAESVGNTLSMKIKTLLYGEIKKEYKVVIGEVLYNIFKLDYDKQNGFMYLYLEEERKIAERDS